LRMQPKRQKQGFRA